MSILVVVRFYSTTTAVYQVGYNIPGTVVVVVRFYVFTAQRVQYHPVHQVHIILSIATDIIPFFFPRVVCVYWYYQELLV